MVGDAISAAGDGIVCYRRRGVVVVINVAIDGVVGYHGRGGVIVVNGIITAGDGEAIKPGVGIHTIGGYHGDTATINGGNTCPRPQNLYTALKGDVLMVGTGGNAYYISRTGGIDS
jgi:hypothetical protein